MVTFADTSFLFSVYAKDIHTNAALDWLRRSGKPVHISELGEYELGNALRFAEFRKVLPMGSAAAFWTQYEADRLAGRVVVSVCNLALVIAEAKRLSSIHTLQGGHRGFDILHVAAALQTGAAEFLSFDGNQKRLAMAEGLANPL